jgi:hypothetical protein
VVETNEARLICKREEELQIKEFQGLGVLIALTS